MKALLSLSFILAITTNLFAQKSAEYNFDSLKLGNGNKVELHYTISVGADYSSNTLGAGFYNEITLCVVDKFDFGIATAFEIMEKREEYNISKIPIYIVQNFKFYNNLYLTFRPCYTIPYNVTLYNKDYSSIQSPLYYGASNILTIHNPNELLKSGIGVAFGLIWKFNEELNIQLLYQNQASGLYNPFANRLDYFSARIGVILR